MPPWMIGCSIPKSSVILVFMLYLLNEVKRTHSVSVDEAECRRGDGTWANAKLTGYSAGLWGAGTGHPGGAARAVFAALISPQRLAALHRRAEYPFVLLPWWYNPLRKALSFLQSPIT